MKDTSYKFRLLEELDELDGRIHRLKSVVFERNIKIVIDDEEKVKLLNEQLKAMTEYRTILLKRINLEYS